MTASTILAIPAAFFSWAVDQVVGDYSAEADTPTPDVACPSAHTVPSPVVSAPAGDGTQLDEPELRVWLLDAAERGESDYRVARGWPREDQSVAQVPRQVIASG